MEASKQKDYFGSVLEWTRGVKRMTMPLVHSSNKMTNDVKRKDGTVHIPVTPEAMATIVYFAGLMVIFSHYAEILTLSLDGAAENGGHSGLGWEAMCAHNSPMECPMIRHSIWKTVESTAERLGLKRFLNWFYGCKNPEGLLQELEDQQRKERKEKRAAGRAKKAKDGGSAVHGPPDTSHAPEPSVRECTQFGESGCSDDVGASGIEALERVDSESSVTNQGGERNANTAGEGLSDVPECTSSVESGCSDDEDGAGAKESNSDPELSSSGDSDQSARGSGEPAGSATQDGARSAKLLWIGLPAPKERDPPRKLNTLGPVEPFREQIDNDKQHEDGAASDEAASLRPKKYDYDFAVNVLRRRHRFLRDAFQRWSFSISKPPLTRDLVMNRITMSRLKKYGDPSLSEAAAAVAAPGVGKGPGVNGGGVCVSAIDRLRDNLAVLGNSLMQMYRFIAVFKTRYYDKEIPSGVSPDGGGDDPAGAAGAAGAAGVDDMGLEEDSATAAAEPAKAKARLAQAVFRYRLKLIRCKAYVSSMNSSTRFKYWIGKKSKRFVTRKNPLRYFACYDQRKRVRDSAWSKICTAAHCMQHRFHNATKRFFTCLNNGLFHQVQAAAACIKSLFVWVAIKGAVDLLLGSPTQLESAKMRDVDTEFYESVQGKVKENYEENKGVSLDDVMKDVEYDPDQGILQPQTCIDIRWGTIANSASHLLSHHRLYLFGMIRRFSKCLEEPQIRAAVSVFSEKGFVSNDSPDINIDAQVQRAFGLLSKPSELAQLAIVDFVNTVCIQPMMNGLSSDNHCAVDEMMGVDSIPRRMIYLFERGLWLRTGSRGWCSKHAVLSRTDGGEFSPDPKSLHLLDVNCNINSILGSAGNEKTRGAVKKLLEHFKVLAKSGQEVVPEDLLSALKIARPGRPASTSENWDETSYASNMSKLIYVFKLVCADVVESVRCEFDREIYGIQGLCGGMIKQRRSTVMLMKSGVRGENDIVSAHPIALANAFVLLVLAMDLAAHHAQELREYGAEIEDFVPSYNQVLSKSCRDEEKKFLGIQKGECRAVDEVPLAPESLTLNKKYNTYEKRINGETTKLSMPLCWYPDLLNWSIMAQCSCASSNCIEQAFSTPSILGRGKGNSSFRVVTRRFRMHNVKTSGWNIRKTESSRFKLARKLAKLRGWRDAFKEDRVKSDAMSVDHMRQSLPVYIQLKGGWKKKSHEQPCRPSRFVNPAEGTKEQGYVDRLTQKVCVRTGTHPPSRSSCKRRIKTASPCGRKAQKSKEGSSPESSAPCNLRTDSQRGDADVCPGASVVSAAAGEEASHDGDGGSESLECHESQVLEEAEAVACSESAAGANETDQIHPGNAALNVQFNPASSVSAAGSASNEVSAAAAEDCVSPGVGSMDPTGSAGPADSEGPPAARSQDEHEGVECEMHDAVPTHHSGDSAARADETDQGPPGNVTEAEPLADSDVVAEAALAVVKQAKLSRIWSIDFLFEVHNAIYYEHGEEFASVFRTWKESKVTYMVDRGGLYASIQRRPGFKCNFSSTTITFAVRPNSSANHYIMYDQYAGAMIVFVTSLQKPVDKDWNKTVAFRRVYTTDEAIERTDQQDGGRMGYMGKKALRGLKKNDKDHNQTTYHTGDCEYHGDIRNMIGVVQWMTASARGRGVSVTWLPAYKLADLIYIGPHISESVLPSGAS